MSEQKYNGWSNYATWRVNLEVCEDLINMADGEQFASIIALATYLENEVDDVLTNYGELKEGLALDYARSFVEDVDWYEIAENHAKDSSLIEDDEDTDE